MKTPPMLETVLWLLLVATVTACGSAAQAPKGSLFESSDAPIPLRAGYWAQQPAFPNARFTGGGVEDVSLGATIESGLVALARSNFRDSAQFESQAEALASPIVDVVVVPTIGQLAMEKDPDGFGVKQIATVRMEWRVSDKTGRVLWSNMVIAQWRDSCLVQRCRQQFAERAVREHIEAAAALMRGHPWWERASK
ncbi:MAG TPA: hypothetical protein VMI34_06975 [Candidatus Bathyarchaeia archaeon]|nr:hypothetical protein [Candidatus Bathyarchaeia archaeon]